MLKLELPLYTCDQAIEYCCQGITGNTELLDKVSQNSTLLRCRASDYATFASEGKLYTITATLCRSDSDPLIVGQLKKSDLLTLYGTYLLKQGKPGRIIYDGLIAAANEKCPYCGGIGRPKNLDHYLPKSHYPEFSVLPVNLVPSCRDCNMDGKGTFVATREEEQVLHPYLDNDRYFNEQWLFAQYIADTRGEPGVIKYFVQPPEHWEDAQKRRVEKHFNDFDLGLRFSKEAASRLVIYFSQILLLIQKSLDLDDAKSTILKPVIDAAPFVNHWERVMCLALMRELRQIRDVVQEDE